MKQPGRRRLHAALGARLAVWHWPISLAAPALVQPNSCTLPHATGHTAAWTAHLFQQPNNVKKVIERCPRLVRLCEQERLPPPLFLRILPLAGGTLTRMAIQVPAQLYQDMASQSLVCVCRAAQAAGRQYTTRFLPSMGSTATLILLGSLACRYSSRSS